MKGKNIIAALLVSLLSVALAVGITFIIASGNSSDLTFQTPAPQNTSQAGSTPVSGFPLVDQAFSPTPLPSENCTFPIEIWVQYPGAWKIESYRIGDKVYTKKEMVDILRGNSSDVRGRLLTQIFVVVLNQQNGADVTNIRTAFAEAIDWLENFPPGSTPSDGDLQKANFIARTLVSFNEGSLGPQSCMYDLAAATVAPVTGQFGVPGTATLTGTSTPYRPIRVQPTDTPQPKEERKPTRPPATAVPPTPVPPTSVPPTAEFTTVPTDAPPPPTDVPTEPPQPTVAATDPPAPTDPPQPTAASTDPPVPTTPQSSPVASASLQVVFRPVHYYASLVLLITSIQ